MEDDNHLRVFRTESFNSNGNTIDRERRLITREHSGRRVTRTEFDGTIATKRTFGHRGGAFQSRNRRSGRSCGQECASVHCFLQSVLMLPMLWTIYQEML
jgi:gluconolactonase